GEAGEVDGAIEAPPGERAIERVGRAVDVDALDAIAERIRQAAAVDQSDAVAAAQQLPDHTESEEAIAADHEHAHRANLLRRCVRAVRCAREAHRSPGAR